MKRVVMLLVAAALVALPACSSQQPKPPEHTDKIEDSLITSTLGTNIQLIDDSFAWDSDGDGLSESFFISYIDNGDEAPNVTEIWRQDGEGGSVFIDRCYEITAIDARSDGYGPYLLITYYSGTYYNHDALGLCALRLSNDQLTVTYLNDD